MAIRTSTTATTSSRPSSSAESSVPFGFEALVQAYKDCRRHKRNTGSAIAFERRLECNLFDLYEELISRVYRPGTSICFVVTHPKPREVWAGRFRDRVVHHLLINHIGPAFVAAFSADSCACIQGRGTLYAAKRLQDQVRSITEGGQVEAWYSKFDLSNFFISIEKQKVRELLHAKVTEPWWHWLADAVLMHDPREDFEWHGDQALRDLVPAHKQLINAPDGVGLPIGNLSSQFFANVLLNRLDQYAKHRLGAPHYVRYVDDFVMLHRDRAWHNAVRDHLQEWLPANLAVRINPRKTRKHRVARGIDFVGQVVFHSHRTLRRSTFRSALHKVRTAPVAELHQTVNSYFGLLRQASHSHADRADLSNVVRQRGHCVDAAFTKTFRRTT